MRKFYLTLLALVTSAGFTAADAAFQDIRLDLTNGKFLTSGETSVISAGVAVAADGSVNRVAADAANAAAVITGKYHSDQHGLSNFKAVVAVEGPVKITYGGCNWGGNVTVKNAEGTEVVPAFTTSIGACWSNTKPAEAIVEKYYAGGATTLTIEGGAYVPYFAVEASAPVTQYTVSYTNSDALLEGTLPNSVTVTEGESVTLPFNHLLYKEGYTVTGWSDGATTYAPGAQLKVDKDYTLSPVATANEVNFADREETVEVIWDFQQKNGAPVVSCQGKTMLYVGQGQMQVGKSIEELGAKAAVLSFSTMGLYGAAGTTSNRIVGVEDTDAEGFTLTATSGKDFTSFTRMIVEGNQHMTFVANPGEQIKIDLPAGKKAAKLVLYSTVSGEGTTAAGWSEVNGKTPDMAMTSVRNAAKPDVFEAECAGETSLTFTAQGEKVAFVAVVYTVDEATDLSAKGTAAIDVPMTIDATNGKVANGNWSDWAQMNGGTVLTIPAAKGMVVSLESYSATTTTTIAGSTNYDKTEGNVVTYTYKGSKETIDIVIGNGSYFRYVKVQYPVVAAVERAFRNFALDFSQAGIITADEISNGQAVNFGISVAADGTVSRIAADDAAAEAAISGTHHKDVHGLCYFKAAVKVDGPVKITMGGCNWGGTVKVTNAAGEEVVKSFTTSIGACWNSSKPDQAIVEVYYAGEATTLTVEGGAYVPYFAVTAVDEEDIPKNYNITFSLGDSGFEGQLPADDKIEQGTEYTIPGNFQMYKEGYSLRWTDGKNTYAPGQTIKPEGDLALTAVAQANKVSLADRTEAVTVRFDFQQKNGAPVVGYQNQTGVWVAQATVNGETIDVKADFDTNNGGKFANGNWQDWAQLNGGTKFTVPSCKGAIVSMEAYSTITTTTIDGQKDYAQGTVISYTIGGNAETVDVVIGDGSYYRYIQVVLPFVAAPQGKTFTNEAATINWAMNSSAAAPATVTPDGGFTLTTVAIGEDLDEQSAQKPNWADEAFVTVKPTAGASGQNDADAVEFKAVPYKGLTFTPSHVSGNIARYGTDGGIMDIVVKNAEGKSAVLATGLIPQRNNKTVDDDAKKDEPGFCNSFSFDVADSMATAQGFSLFVYIYGLGTTKTVGINNVIVTGTVNGTQAEVTKYTLEAKVNTADGGTASLYPAGGEYDEGTEVQLTATRNFGYKFVNWTAEDGSVVSEAPKFTYTLNANAVITANFEKINTYAVAVNVEAPAKDYMVEWSPAATEVDGKKMYEEGTELTLTANSNDVITFTGWSDGETSSEKKFAVTKDVTLDASYAAADFIVAWDFWQKGSTGRVADFAAADNDADQLVLRQEDGTTSGWLDKSRVNGGYEGRPAAVNWRTGSKNGDVGNWYWQTKINAAAFTDIKVKSAMAYNYNAYQTQLVEYSLDDATWTTVGKIEIPSVKNWIDAEFTLPAECNNQAAVYIRWKSDKTSNIDGTGSANDGISLGAIYITGTPKLIDDGQAPKLVSSVPAEGSKTASANGKVVLTFDEKVKIAVGITATLNGKNLAGSVSGKTVIFEYTGLDYATDYTFSLPGNSIADLTDNYLAEAINIAFTTKEKPYVTKGLYDFVVPTDGTIRQAIEAAAKREDTSKRFRIFIMKGTYIIPQDSTKSVTNAAGVSNPDPKTYITTPNISIIGEDMAETIVKNTVSGGQEYGKACPNEGLRNVDVFQITGAGQNLYFQDLYIANNTADATGRNCALTDQGNKNVFKDVTLFGYQDTYLSNNDNGRYYFEGGMLRGRTDYLCGKGDVVYKEVNLMQCETGGYLCAPSNPRKYGYVFLNCEVNAERPDLTNGNFTLGRPWGSGTPTAIFINTVMNVQPSAEGWNEMSGGWPRRFAEYNSVTATGTVIDLSGRKTTFGGKTDCNNPRLTAEEAAEYTVANILGGDDNWDPESMTEQASAPTGLSVEGNTLKWDNSNYVFCWAVCKDGKVIDFTTTPSYEISDKTAKWSVRAANEMGGLGEASEFGSTVGIVEVKDNAAEATGAIYDVMGRRVNNAGRGLYIVNGKTVLNK